MRNRCVLATLSVSTVAARGELINFDNARQDSILPGWIATVTHKGGHPRWEVMQDRSAPNVLGPLSLDATVGRFALPICDKANIANEFMKDLPKFAFHGQALFDIADSTFKEDGTLRRWTEAGSVTYFDDFAIVNKGEPNWR